MPIRNPGELYSQACQAMSRAYSPYSKYKVGAAIPLMVNFLLVVMLKMFHTV